jgi:hypothetical protein
LADICQCGAPPSDHRAIFPHYFFLSALFFAALRGLFALLALLLALFLTGLAAGFLAFFFGAFVPRFLGAGGGVSRDGVGTAASEPSQKAISFAASPWRKRSC